MVGAAAHVCRLGHPSGVLGRFAPAGVLEWPQHAPGGAVSAVSGAAGGLGAGRSRAPRREPPRAGRRGRRCSRSRSLYTVLRSRSSWDLRGRRLSPSRSASRARPALNDPAWAAWCAARRRCSGWWSRAPRSCCWRCCAGARWLAVGALVLVAADLAWAGVGYNPAIDRAVAVAAGDRRRSASCNAPRPERFVIVGNIPENAIPMDYKIPEARGYDLPVEERFDRLWRSKLSPEFPSQVGPLPAFIPLVLPKVDEERLRYLSFLGVSRVLQPPTDPLLRTEGLRMVYDRPGRADLRQRRRVAAGVRRGRAAARRRRLHRDHRRGLRRAASAVVESGKSEGSPGLAGPAQILHTENDRQVVEIRTTRPGHPGRLRRVGAGLARRHGRGGAQGRARRLPLPRRPRARGHAHRRVHLPAAELADRLDRVAGGVVALLGGVAVATGAQVTPLAAARARRRAGDRRAARARLPRGRVLGARVGRGRVRPAVGRAARRRRRRLLPAVGLSALRAVPGRADTHRCVCAAAGAADRPRVLGRADCRRDRAPLHEVWANVPLFYGFAQVYRDSTAGQGLGQAWTLCVEVLFYAFLPLWALLLADRALCGRWWRCFARALRTKC